MYFWNLHKINFKSFYLQYNKVNIVGLVSIIKLHENLLCQIRKCANKDMEKNLKFNLKSNKPKLLKL